MVALLLASVLIAPVVNRGDTSTDATEFVTCESTFVEQLSKVTNAVFPERTVLPTNALVPKALAANTRLVSARAVACIAATQNASAINVRNIVRSLFKRGPLFMLNGRSSSEL